MSSHLIPAAYSVWKEGYDFKRFTSDAMAGILVGIVALPLAIAFAIASGCKPEQGIFTAVTAGLCISALGGSRVQIGGPTGAFIVIVFGIVSQFGYSGLAIATLMAGVMLIAMGLARMGSVIKFVPYPMTVGFTSGIALIIGSTQIKDLLGLPTKTGSAEFVHNMIAYAKDLPNLNPYALGVGIISLIIILVWQQFIKKIPGSIVAIVAATAIVHLLNLPVDTIGSRFGAVPSALPVPSLPAFEWSRLSELVQPAVAIALLGAIESLLSAVVADGMIGTRHRSNMELVAQGIANLVSPIFGGLPATGAIARTATNIKNGGTTPVAGIIHAITLLLLLMFLGPWAQLVPMATLAAVLLIVAYNMSEWRHFVGLFKAPRPDILVMLATFGLTVFVDLVIAIEVGMVLAAMLFMHRMANATEVRRIVADADEDFDQEDFKGLRPDEVPPGVEVFEIHGPFFFGAANKFSDTLSIVKEPPMLLIIRMRHILSIDATGMRAFSEMIDKLHDGGTQVMLSGVRPELHAQLQKASILTKVGPSNVFAHIDLALERARQLIATRHAAQRTVAGSEG
ncbi:MAG: SulP family inorganic anion transporter [Desulfovibrionaceae bacterium]